MFKATNNHVKQFIMFLLLFLGITNSIYAKKKLITLTQDKLVEILVDLELAKATIYDVKNSDQPETMALFKEQAKIIYKAHNVDEQVLYDTYLRYITDPVKSQILYDQVLNRLEKLLEDNN